jgi:hypothetical protein
VEGPSFAHDLADGEQISCTPARRLSLNSTVFTVEPGKPSLPKFPGGVAEEPDEAPVDDSVSFLEVLCGTADAAGDPFSQ